MRVETLALSRLGVSLWRDFDAEFGAGYGRPGGLRVAESERDIALLRQTTEEQRQAGLPLEWLEGNALRDLAPWLGPSMRAGTFCEEDAQSSPLIAGAGLVRAVRRAGASVLSGCALTAVAAEAGGFCLSTAQGGMRARKLVLAAGPWSGAFLPMLGVSLPLHVDVNMLTITEPSVPVFDRVVSHIAGILTLKQYANGTCLIGGGWQGRGVFGAGLKEVDHLRLKQNWRTAAAVIPGLARLRALRSWAGYQAVTLDALPVVGPLGGGAFIAMGARGGYTMGPAIGLCAAEMVQGRAAPVPLHDFRPGRFAS